MKKSFRKSKMPDAFVIMAAIMLLAAVLTHLLPAGTYEYIEGTSLVNPNSFHFVTKSPVSLWQVIRSVSLGMENSSAIIFMILLTGGYFNVLTKTQAIDNLIGAFIRRAGDHYMKVLACISLVMALLGAAGVIANSVVAFISLGLVFAKKMNKDKKTALGMILVSAYCGFSTSPMAAATVQLAQSYADVSLLSGFGFRTIVFASLYVVMLIYLLRYAKKCTKTDIAEEDAVPEHVDGDYTIRDILVLVVFGAGLTIYVYGSLVYNWTFVHLEGVMLVVSILSAVITNMGVDGYINAFLSGVKKMCYSAMLVGCAAAVAIILEEGNILHTLVYAMSNFLLKLPKWLAGPMMFYFNILFNFFVSSGSGQARIVMPILAPMADVIGISRQMAICAYQYGDGLSNLIFPTNGTMMACISIAGISYDKWLKWMLPLFFIWMIMISVWMVIGVRIGIC